MWNKNENPNEELIDKLKENIYKENSINPWVEFKKELEQEMKSNNCIAIDLNLREGDKLYRNVMFDEHGRPWRIIEIEVNEQGEMWFRLEEDLG